MRAVFKLSVLLRVYIALRHKSTICCIHFTFVTLLFISYSMIFAVVSILIVYFVNILV